MSLFEELLEFTSNDEKIVKSFKTKDTLCTDIFTKKNNTYHLRSEVKKQLLEISEHFLESIGIDLFIYDIVLTGSLANYNWSSFSDIDLHLVVDTKEITEDKPGMIEILKELFDAKKNLWNEKYKVKIKNFDVEVYVQEIDEEHVSSGVYSIMNDEWVVEPTKEKPVIDDKKILQKGDDFSRKIESLINQKHSNIKELIKKIDSLRKKIRDFRQTGLEDGGEFSYENLTFKLLRRNGLIEKLLNYKKELVDNDLSMNQ